MNLETDPVRTLAPPYSIPSVGERACRTPGVEHGVQPPEHLLHHLGVFHLNVNYTVELSHHGL